MRLGAQFNFRIDQMVQGNQAAIQVEFWPSEWKDGSLREVGLDALRICSPLCHLQFPANYHLITAKQLGLCHLSCD